MSAAKTRQWCCRRNERQCAAQTGYHVDIEVIIATVSIKIM
jgi:hypothetical protein